MRKLIVTNIASLDGYTAGPGGNVMVLPMDAAFDAYNAERLREASTLLLGRNSYLGFKSYWPSVADDVNQSPDNREISRLNNAIEKVVISETLTAQDTAPWSDTTRIVRRTEANEQVAALKQEDGGDILVFGSGTMWNGLLQDGLVDELHLMVGSAFLGGGVPAILDPPDVEPMPNIGARPFMKLLGVRTFEGSDNVLLQYAPRR